MANPYEQLTIKQLEKIINCESYDKLLIILEKHQPSPPQSAGLGGRNNRDNDGYFENTFIKKLPFHEYLRKKNTSFFESLYSAITYAQLPIQLLWLVTAFVSLGVAAMWIFGGVVGLAGTLLIGLTAYHTKQQRDKSLQDKKDLALTGIKIEAIRELFRRKNFDEPLQTPAIENVLVNKRESFELGMLLTLNLAFTYWGTRDLLLYVGLMSTATIFAGPFGLAIVAGATILLGIAYGIQHHYYQQKNNPVQSLKKSLDVVLNENKAALKTLEKTSRLNLEHKVHHPPSQPSPTLARGEGVIPKIISPQEDGIISPSLQPKTISTRENGVIPMPTDEDSPISLQTPQEDKNRSYTYLPKFNIFKSYRPKASNTKEPYPLKRSGSF